MESPLHNAHGSSQDMTFDDATASESQPGVGMIFSCRHPKYKSERWVLHLSVPPCMVWALAQILWPWTEVSLADRRLLFSVIHLQQSTLRLVVQTILVLLTRNPTTPLRDLTFKI